MEFVTINTNGGRKGHYSPGVISNGTLYISGQLSVDMDTKMAPARDIRVHAKLALANLAKVLKAAGAEKTDVVQCRVYIEDVKYWEMVDEEYKLFFGEHTPARSIVPVKQLHFNAMVEIEATAEVKRTNQ